MKSTVKPVQVSEDQLGNCRHHSQSVREAWEGVWEYCASMYLFPHKRTFRSWEVSIPLFLFWDLFLADFILHLDFCLFASFSSSLDSVTLSFEPCHKSLPPSWLWNSRPRSKERSLNSSLFSDYRTLLPHWERQTSLPDIQLHLVFCALTVT